LIKLFVLVAVSQFPLLNPVTQQIFRHSVRLRGVESDVNAFPLYNNLLAQKPTGLTSLTKHGGHHWFVFLLFQTAEWMHQYHLSFSIDFHKLILCASILRSFAAVFMLWLGTVLTMCTLWMS